MKKLSILLCLALAIALLSAVAAFTEGIVTIGEYEPKVEKLTIQTTNRVIPEGNLIDTWLEESLGVQLDWIILSGGDLSTKINLLAASEELPDVMTLPYSTNRADYEMLLSEGLLVDLEPLIDTYGPNIRKYRTDEQLEALREKDGTIYAINAAAVTEYNMFCIRQDWLDHVGLSMPTTTKEFEEVLRAFVEKDPDGNGKDDTYGLFLHNPTMSRFNLFWAAFEANPYQWIYADDGSIVFGATKTQPLAKAVSWLQHLYAEGLINKDYLTATQLNLQEEAKANKQGLCEIQLWWTDQTQIHEIATDPNAKWVAIPGLYSEDSIGFGYLTSTSPKVNRYTCISVDSKDPELAMLYLDFIGDEDNYFKIRKGIEGVHYEWNEEHTHALAIGEYAKDGSLLINNGITATYAMPFLAQDAVPGLFGPTAFEYYAQRLENEPRFYAALYDVVPAISDNQLDMGMKEYIEQCVNNLIIDSSLDVQEGIEEMVAELYGKYNLELQTQYINEYAAQ